MILAAAAAAAVERALMATEPNFGEWRQEKKKLIEPESRVQPLVSINHLLALLWPRRLPFAAAAASVFLFRRNSPAAGLNSGLR